LYPDGNLDGGDSDLAADRKSAASNRPANIYTVAFRCAHHPIRIVSRPFGSRIPRSEPQLLLVIV